MPKMKNVAILVSGGGTNLQAFIDADAKNYNIVCVGSDNPTAGALTRAKNAGIPTFILAYKEFENLNLTSPGRLGYSVPHDFNLIDALQKSGFKDSEKSRTAMYIRAAAEYQLLEQLKKFEVDVVVLAGFERILSAYFLDHFQPDPFRPRVLNIHPALLPSFPGQHGYEDAFDYGVVVHGATVHYVDYGEDTGPIIDQSCYKKMRGEEIESFKKRGLELEWKLYVNAFKLHCDDRLKIIKRKESGRRVVDEIPAKRFNPR